MALGHSHANFQDSTRLGAFVRELRPDLIVNAAEYTAVDMGEERGVGRASQQVERTECTAAISLNPF
jgi:dTDP-4-dehydrorhamnose reductase